MSSNAVAPSEMVEGVRIIRDTREALYHLEKDREIAIDLETSGLIPHKDKVAVVSLYGDESSALGVLHVKGTIPPELKAFLEEPHRRFTYHNGTAFDIPFLMAAGVDADKPQLYDTLVGAALIPQHSRRDRSISLKAEVDKRLGVTLSKDSGGHGHWMDPQLTEQQIRYCAEDIVHIHGLRRNQVAEAEASGQQAALQLENEIHGAVARMTHNGLPISIEALHGYLAEMRQQEQELYSELSGTLGKRINFGSHVQVKAALRQMGVDVPTTEADFLEQVVANGPSGLLEGADYRLKTGKPTQVNFARAADLLGPEASMLGEDVLAMLAKNDEEQAERAIDFMEKMMALRQAMKAQQSYGDNFQATHIWQGLVHSRFKQAGTDTGRFSSSEPNLQQVTKGMRWVFGHKEGYKIVSVDYSQIEVVVAAYLANDQALIDLIMSGGDIHTLVAAQIFQVDPASIDKKDVRRRLAKACSFTLLFGGGAARLVEQARQEGAKITLREGKDIVELFFRQFKGALRDRQKAYELSQSGRNAIQIQLPSGLKRLLVGHHIKPTTILNTRVQGTAAAGMKNAIRLAHKRGLTAHLGATVHDELVAYVPSEWAEDYAQYLGETMIEGMARYVKIPARVGITIGDTWE